MKSVGCFVDLISTEAMPSKSIFSHQLYRLGGWYWQNWYHWDWPFWANTSDTLVPLPVNFLNCIQCSSMNQVFLSDLAAWIWSVWLIFTSLVDTNMPLMIQHLTTDQLIELNPLKGGVGLSYQIFDCYRSCRAINTPCLNCIRGIVDVIYFNDVFMHQQQIRINLLK